MEPHGPTVITSRSNHRIVAARKLVQRKHRQRQKCFLVEGLQLLHMALEADILPLEVFYCEDLFNGTQAGLLLCRFRQAGSSLVPVGQDILQVLSQRDRPQGLVAVLPTFDTPLESLRPGRDRLVVVLDRLQDPGNMGTLIRAADAVGAAAVVLIEPCADVFDPRTVRSSMGSLFNVPLARSADVGKLFGWLREQGLRLVGADTHQGRAWGKGLWRGGVALILGNEAQGLSGDVRAQLDDWARLPMLGRVDSLNVAVAGGVLMYEWLQERLANMV